MKAIILAGGLGTRISEETDLKPKPMIEIGNKPILWHIMKTYSAHNVNDFIICCGYKGYIIKEYFANYFLHMSDVTFSMKTNKTQYREPNVTDAQFFGHLSASALPPLAKVTCLSFSLISS